MCRLYCTSTEVDINMLLLSNILTWYCYVSTRVHWKEWRIKYSLGLYKAFCFFTTSICRSFCRVYFEVLFLLYFTQFDYALFYSSFLFNFASICWTAFNVHNCILPVYKYKCYTNKHAYALHSTHIGLLVGGRKIHTNTNVWNSNYLIGEETKKQI